MSLNLQFQRVLIIDDDEVFGTAMARWLLELGFEADHAGTVRDAVDILNGGCTPTLIFLDLCLPDLSGHALLHQFRRQGFPAPVIVISGTDDVREAVRAMREQPADFLKKPFSLDELSAAIERALATQAPLGGAVPAAAYAAAPRPLPNHGYAVAASTAAPPPQPGPPTPPPSAAEAAPESAGKAAPQKVRAIVSLLNDAIRDGSISIPVVDPNVANLQQFLTRSDYTMQEVADAVGRDGALAAGVLRIANSAQYSRGAEVTSLFEACTRLGSNRVVGIGLEVAVRNQFTLSEEPFRTLMASLWRNAVLTARIVENLARAMGRSDVEDLYVGALLHNLGEIVCVKLFADLKRLGQPVPELPRMCTEIYKLHEHFGRAVASTWKLPKRLLRVIGHHHRPASTPEPPDDRIVRLLVLGSWSLALEQGYTYFPEHAATESQRQFQVAGVPAGAVEKVVQAIPTWGV